MEWIGFEVRARRGWEGVGRLSGITSVPGDEFGWPDQVVGGGESEHFSKPIGQDRTGADWNGPGVTVYKGLRGIRGFLDRPGADWSGPRIDPSCWGMC